VLRNANRDNHVLPLGLPFTLRCIRDAVRTFGGKPVLTKHEVVDMLDKQTRGAILVLRRKGHSLRSISRLLSLSRDSVRKVAKVGSDEPPIILRPCKLDAHREKIAHLLAKFDGTEIGRAHV